MRRSRCNLDRLWFDICRYVLVRMAGFSARREPAAVDGWGAWLTRQRANCPAWQLDLTYAKLFFSLTRKEFIGTKPS